MKILYRHSQQIKLSKPSNMPYPSTHPIQFFLTFTLPHVSSCSFSELGLDGRHDLLQLVPRVDVAVPTDLGVDEVAVDGDLELAAHVGRGLAADLDLVAEFARQVRADLAELGGVPSGATVNRTNNNWRFNGDR